ncbi:MAG: amino acid ABC transporter [Sulfobacillus benefaciens]|uniref:Amino acid ABC transporter n=1 Tax=Sulfobacillus benefaciens TaxID=453960 RepID=A0A2T2XCZ3_9FIRM|nr:MAG: amino acid ABC transporter [Sulfobacillus benefaciens]
MNGFIGVVLLVVFGVAPGFYANTSILFQMMMYIVLAQGVNVLYGFTGYLPFGYVGFFGAGAYGASLAIQMGHLPGSVAMGVGAMVSVVLGLVLLPLLRLAGAYFAIGSMAAAEIVYYVVSNPALDKVTNGPYGIQLVQSYHPVESYAFMVGALGLVTLGVMILRHSRIGMALLALREDSVSAAMIGINVVTARAGVWLASALVAGLAGAIFAWHTSVFYPTTVFDLNISVFAIVFTLFGGAGTVLGPTVGVVVLFGLYNVIGISSPQYFQLLFGVLIVTLVLFLPNGVVSLLRRRGWDVP